VVLRTLWVVHTAGMIASDISLVLQRSALPRQFSSLFLQQHEFAILLNSELQLDSSMLLSLMSGNDMGGWGVLTAIRKGLKLKASVNIMRNKQH